MSKRDNDRNASRQMLNKLSQYSQKELYGDDDDDDDDAFLSEIENLKTNKKTQKSETKKRRNEEY